MGDLNSGKTREFLVIHRAKNTVTWIPIVVHLPWNLHSIDAHVLSLP